MIKQYPKNKEYFISDTGDVYRVHKLKATPQTKGYLRVTITDRSGRKPKRKEKYVHRLVMETFKGKELTKDLQVNHLDKNKENNTIDNLEIVTLLENIIHRDTQDAF